MFTAQHVAVAFKKERLLGRIDVQRQRIAEGAALFKKPLSAADKLLSGVQYVKERPWIAAVALVSTMVIGRRRVFSWGVRAFTAWRAWGRARRWMNEHGYINN